MEEVKNILGKIIYGCLFVVVLPYLLILWAGATDNLVQIPVPDYPYIGLLNVGIGLYFIFSGMFSLWYYGEGLPMNAYPPDKFVSKGVYSFTSHPIYLGSILVSFGLSIWVKSSSGFWLVSPLFLFMIVAYVLGFEKEKTEKLFGVQAFKPFLSLAEGNSQSTNLKSKLATFILIFIPWLILYEAFVFIGNPMVAISTNTMLDEYIPLIDFTIIAYSSVYIFTLLVPFILKTNEQLRNFTIDAWLSMIIVFSIYFCLPFVVEQREFSFSSCWTELIKLERSMDSAAAAFPSYHVMWALLSAKYYTQILSTLKTAFFFIATLISMSCLTTGNHTILDVLAGLAVYFIIEYRIALWFAAKNKAEKIANTWIEWRYRNVRFIHHGIYAGLASLIGAFLISSFLHDFRFITTMSLTLSAILGAALWAQFIEGSPKLQRPYSFYGSIVGTGFAVITLGVYTPLEASILAGALVMAAPWVQMIGRLRCLVQGCCHGCQTSPKMGIQFHHPMSRVNKISELSGRFLHPTQLYSMIANFITGVFLIRFYFLEMPINFLVGFYFIANGLFRFVEESLRGEAQTPYWLRMRIYQCFALLSIFIGALITCVSHKTTLVFRFSNESLLTAIVAAVITAIAYGLDFPKSNKRFARLVE
ncbi:MAG: prolipoprotein diacylglyceryl transferase [Chitinophagales bacterium]|nr:prolipoprotein diacylglyceryl transferase [Chitinophagales bacterium]